MNKRSSFRSEISDSTSVSSVESAGTRVPLHLKEFGGSGGGVSDKGLTGAKGKMRRDNGNSAGEPKHRKSRGDVVQSVGKRRQPERLHGLSACGEASMATTYMTTTEEPITCTLAAKDVVFLEKNRGLREALLAIEDLHFGEIAKSFDLMASFNAPPDVKTSRS